MAEKRAVGLQGIRVASFKRARERRFVEYFDEATRLHIVSDKCPGPEEGGLTLVKYESTKTSAVWRSGFMHGGRICGGSETTFSTILSFRGSIVNAEGPLMVSTMYRNR